MIEKITDQNLERYDSRLKEWCDRKFFEKGNYGKYETTEEAGIVAFYPAPNTTLEGKVKFSFKETMPVSGDKGPDNPSTIAGMNSVDVIRWGKNINNDVGPVSWPNGYSRYATRDSDGWIIGEVPANIDYNPAWQTRFNRLLPAQHDYCLVIEIAAISNLFGLRFSYHNTDNMPQLYNDSYRTPEIPGIYVIPLFHYTTHQHATEPINLLRPDTWSVQGMKKNVNEAAYIKYRLSVLPVSASSINIADFKYEAFTEQVYTINLNSTYYGGEIDLATGMMTIICQKVLIDENCSYTLLTDETNEDRVAVVVTIPDFLSSDEFKLLRSTSSCDSFPLVQYQNITNSDECIMFGGQWQVIRYKQLRVYMLRSTLGVSSSATATEVQEAAKTWFTSHPATFIAGYEEPFWTTIHLTPVQISALTQLDKYTPRLNTVYTDADSVQISYLKSPIRDEYEKTQAILSLGGNS